MKHIRLFKPNKCILKIATSICYFSFLNTFGQTKTPLDNLSRETGLLLKDDVTRMLIHNSSGDRAHNYVTQLSTWDRTTDEGDYQQAANWVKNKASEFGLSEVEIETYTADGKTEYFGSKPESSWIAKKGELWATAPYRFKITSFEDLPMSLGLNSSSVDTTAELVDIGWATENDYARKDVKNKIVLTNQNPYMVAQKAIGEKGAIGVVSSYSVPFWDYTNRLPGDFPDQVGWAGIVPVEGKRQFAFLISERKARELKLMLERKQKIMLHASIESQVIPGKMKIVSGIIKGSAFPDEEIVITAHLDHYKPGANDNASGSAAILEMARTLNYLIASRQIPPPLRTIRFLWLPEFKGSTAWLSRHASETKKRIINLNFDMLGANLLEVNSQFSINYTPDWNGHFINALSASALDFINKYNNTRYPRRKDYQIISVNGSRNAAHGFMQPYFRGTDHQVFNDFGIAGVGFSTWPDDNYHSSQDRPEYVDPTQLHRVVFGGLTMILTSAYASAEHAVPLYSLVSIYGLNRLADDEKKIIALIQSSTVENLPGNAYLSKAILKSAFEREKQALRSCQVLTENSSDNDLKNYSILLDKRKKLVAENLDQLISLRAAAFDITNFKAVSPEKDEEVFASLIPERVKGKELFGYYEALSALPQNHPLNLKAFEMEMEAKLNELREQEADELRIYDFQNAMASYANGKRNLVEIRDAVYAEYGVLFSLPSVKTLFQLFEVTGGMNLKSK